MNLIVNSLPTRTWRHLKMNESTVKVEGEFHTHLPEASGTSPEVRWVAQTESEETDLGACSGIVELTKDAPVSILEARTAMTAPVLLTYAYAPSEQAASRLVLKAPENTVLSVVLLLKSSAEAAAVLRTEVYAEKNAKVQLYMAQLLDSRALAITDVSGICADGASVELTRLELGGGKVYTDCHIDLKGKEAAFTTDIGYHAAKGQILDMNYLALHHGPATSSLMEISGTLEEGSRKIFRGTIDFQQGCKEAKGTETENVLLMGENMVNQTIPLILCREEDVEGNHGASIGQLDDKVLFYLGSRGMEPEAAKHLIARSRIEAVCARIPLEEVRQQVHAFEDQRGMLHGEEL